MVRDLLGQLGLTTPQPLLSGQQKLQPHEWYLVQLANEIGMPVNTLYHWLKWGWVRARQETQHPHRWIVWADPSECQRLKHLHQRPRGESSRQFWINKRNAGQSTLHSTQLS